MDNLCLRDAMRECRTLGPREGKRVRVCGSMIYVGRRFYLVEEDEAGLRRAGGLADLAEPLPVLAPDLSSLLEVMQYFFVPHSENWWEVLYSDVCIDGWLGKAAKDEGSLEHYGVKDGSFVLLGLEGLSAKVGDESYSLCEFEMDGKWFENAVRLREREIRERHCHSEQVEEDQFMNRVSHLRAISRLGMA